jgi:hypothetical protein
VLLLPAVRYSPSARPQRRMSLLVTLALATLGASCKRTSGHPDAGGGGEDAGAMPDASRPDAAAPDARVEPDVAADLASPRDLASPDMPPDAGRPDAPADAAGDAGPTNPSRLWFHGPEGDFQLSDMEPETPF